MAFWDAIIEKWQIRKAMAEHSDMLRITKKGARHTSLHVRERRVVGRRHKRRVGPAPERHDEFLIDRDFSGTDAN